MKVTTFNFSFRGICVYVKPKFSGSGIGKGITP